jgi:hypothetical protein
MAAHVESKDHGADALVKALRSVKGAELRVGILDKGDDDHAGLTVAELAAIHEFGLGVPERSFIRGWYDENIDQIRELIKKQLARVARGEVSEVNAWKQLGALFVAQIQKRIVERIPPPLAESTIKAKGSDVPLVDTGQLKSSITFKVE